MEYIPYASWSAEELWCRFSYQELADKPKRLSHILFSLRHLHKLVVERVIHSPSYRLHIVSHGEISNNHSS